MQSTAFKDGNIMVPPFSIGNSAVEYLVIVKQRNKLYSEKEIDTNKDIPPIETIYTEKKRICDVSLSYAGR
jgi:hypothetical protein